MKKPLDTHADIALSFAGSRSSDQQTLLSLIDTIADLAAARSREEVVSTLRSRARALIGADGIAVVFRDGAHSYYAAEDACGPLWAGQRFPLANCASGFAMLRGETVVIADALADPSLPTKVYSSTFVRSLAIAPATPNAALGAYWSDVGTPSVASIAILETLARTAATALENARMVDAIEQLRGSVPDTGMIEAGSADSQAQPFSTHDALQAFDHLPVLAWIADANGHIFRYNQAWYEYTGSSPKAMKGWGWQSVHHPEHLPDVLEAWRGALQSGKAFEATFPLRGADGIYRSFLTRAVPQSDASGAVVRWFGTNTDVSAIEAAEQAAERSEQLLQSIIDHVPAAIYVKDLEGRYTLANSATLDFVGLSWEELRDQTDAAWLNEEESKIVRSNDSRVLKQGAAVEIEEHTQSCAARKVFLSRKAPLRRTDGAIIGLVGSSIDITDKMTAHEALVTREDYLRRVLDQLFSFVGVTSLDGTLAFTNAAPLVAGGVSSEDVWGRKFWECHWWNWSIETQRLCREGIETAAAGSIYRRDLMVRMADDQIIMIDYQAAPLRDEAGEIIAIVHSGVDIEARIQAQRLKDTLIGELHHRVSNLFALMGGLVRMTAFSATDTKAMANALNGRIMALANAHALIRPNPNNNCIDSDADFAALMQRILAPYGEDRYTIDGPPLALGQKAVTSLALIFHELATNAAKYGALSQEHGTVCISWHVNDANVNVSWKERGGPTITEAPSREGFGSELLNVSAESQLGGKCHRVWKKSGLIAEISLPIANLR